MNTDSRAALVASLRDGESDSRVRDALATAVAEAYESQGVELPSGLELNKLRKRTTDIRLEGETVVFSIERHGGFVPREQQWAFQLGSGVLHLRTSEPLFYKVEECAAILGRSPSSVLRYIKQGKLCAKRAWATQPVYEWADRQARHGSALNMWELFSMVPHNMWLIDRDECKRLASILAQKQSDYHHEF